MTKMGGRLALGFGALSDGVLLSRATAASRFFRRAHRLAREDPDRPGHPPAHPLRRFGLRPGHSNPPLPVPALLGTGSALAILERYERLVEAGEEELEDIPEHVLAAGDFLVARSVYLPGDCRLLVLD